MRDEPFHEFSSGDANLFFLCCRGVLCRTRAAVSVSVKRRGHRPQTVWTETPRNICCVHILHMTKNQRSLWLRLIGVGWTSSSRVSAVRRRRILPWRPWLSFSLRVKKTTVYIAATKDLQSEMFWLNLCKVQLSGASVRATSWFLSRHLKGCTLITFRFSSASVTQQH